MAPGPTRAGTRSARQPHGAGPDSGSAIHWLTRAGGVARARAVKRGAVTRRKGGALQESSLLGGPAQVKWGAEGGACNWVLRGPGGGVQGSCARAEHPAPPPRAWRRLAGKRAPLPPPRERSRGAGGAAGALHLASCTFAATSRGHGQGASSDPPGRSRTSARGVHAHLPGPPAPESGRSEPVNRGAAPQPRSPRRGPRRRTAPLSGHLAQPESPGSGQGRAGGCEPEPSRRPGPAEPAEPADGAPAPRAPSPGRALPGAPSRAEEEPGGAVTREPPPQTREGSAAGEAGAPPHLPARPASPPSRARGLARHPQPRAMMKTLSSGNCALSVPAKNSYRMVVLGASRVGKSSIVSRFLNGRFDDQYTPTIEDFHRKVYNIRGDMYQLDILDTSGNHPFPAMRRLSILTGDVFILVFSLDNRESFDEVKRLQKQILEVKSCLKNKTKEAAELPMVICGNKNDHSELSRQVPTTEAELLVSGDENCAYFEVSAKKNTNVDEMFYVLFSMAKLPHEMSPALHRKISVQYGDAFHPRPFCMRRIKDVDAYGMVSPFARRPSVNSDLKYIKAKVLREGQARERDKCTLQ